MRPPPEPLRKRSTSTTESPHSRQKAWTTVGLHDATRSPISYLGLKGFRLAQMGQIRGFFRSDSVYFGSPSQNIINLSWNVPTSVPFGANLTHFWSKSGHPSPNIYFSIDCYVLIAFVCTCILSTLSFIYLHIYLTALTYVNNRYYISNTSNKPGTNYPCVSVFWLRFLFSNQNN